MDLELLKDIDLKVRIVDVLKRCSAYTDTVEDQFALAAGSKSCVLDCINTRLIFTCMRCTAYKIE